MLEFKNYAMDAPKQLLRFSYFFNQYLKALTNIVTLTKNKDKQKKDK